MSGIVKKCNHEKFVDVPSYYSDTQWCYACGAVRGSNGEFGSHHRWTEWQLPGSEPDFALDLP